MRILLDTHTFLWWISSPDLLPKTLFDSLMNNDNEIWLSTASSWEVEIKAGLGKLKLHEKWEDILQREIECNSLQILPIHLFHTFKLKNLQPLHKDPFDRMLIAQAMAENMVIASKDSLIRQYDGVITLWDD
jgi:PIN domain nuclease of toxin-antitoxin system